jgi:hypothetical protein
VAGRISRPNATPSAKPRSTGGRLRRRPWGHCGPVRTGFESRGEAARRSSNAVVGGGFERRAPGVGRGGSRHSPSRPGMHSTTFELGSSDLDVLRMPHVLSTATSARIASIVVLCRYFRARTARICLPVHQGPGFRCPPLKPPANDRVSRLTRSGRTDNDPVRTGPQWPHGRRRRRPSNSSHTPCHNFAAICAPMPAPGDASRRAQLQLERAWPRTPKS